jgi:hypothetical protein
VNNKYKKSLQEKVAEATKQKEEKRKNPSPRNRKACHNMSICTINGIYCCRHCDAFQEGSADAVACLPAPRA